MPVKETPGIMPPLVTPFGAERFFDEVLHRADVRALLSENLHGLAVCGSTDDGHAVTDGRGSRNYSCNHVKR